nr:MAG TPA: DNA-binding response regulator [Caudoviricetes sp.]
MLLFVFLLSVCFCHSHWYKTSPFNNDLLRQRL